MNAPKPSLRSLALVSLLAAALYACDVETPSAPTSSRTPPRSVAVTERQDLALLARGIALALADDRLRQQVLEDMRDSPFPEHQLHFRSYLGGTRGRLLANAIAQRLGIGTEDIVNLLPATTDFAFLAPVALDRISWTGSPDVIVVASSAGKAGILSRPMLRGFNINGDAIDVPLEERASGPVLALLPAAIAFGENPEAIRSRAPRQQRGTIGSPEAEFRTMQDCNPERDLCGGGGGGGGGQWRGGYALGDDCT